MKLGRKGSLETPARDAGMNAAILENAAGFPGDRTPLLDYLIASLRKLRVRLGELPKVQMAIARSADAPLED